LRISDLQQDLAGWVAGSPAADSTTSDEFLNKAKELLEMYVEEGLESFMVSPEHF
jgi:hypothetical protein